MIKLKRSLNLAQLTFYGVGTIVGAGIYSVIGAAAGDAGSLLWLSFIFAGIAALLTALSYAELSSMFSQAGAEYEYLKHAFRSPLLPFMVGFLVLFNAASTAAAVSIAFGGYLRVFFDLPQLATAFILLLACTAINIAGIKQSTWATMTLVCVEVAGLILLIFAGFEWGQLERNWDFEGQAGTGPEGVVSAAALIFFVYIGFETIANLSEESHNPTRNIPRSMLLSIVITTIIYILVALATIALVEPSHLASSQSPLTEAGRAVAPWMGDALAIAALFSTASTALITLVGISRLLFSMGRSGVMPKITANVLKGRQTPWVAALVLGFGACLFLLLGDLKAVASMTSLGALLVFIGIHAALISLRYKRPDARRPFCVPLSIGKIPVLPVLGILISIIFLTRFQWQTYSVALGILICGLFLYWLRQKKN